jgi:hypothetical protein
VKNLTSGVIISPRENNSSERIFVDVGKSLKFSAEVDVPDG